MQALVSYSLASHLFSGLLGRFKGIIEAGFAKGELCRHPPLIQAWPLLQTLHREAVRHSKWSQQGPGTLPNSPGILSSFFPTPQHTQSTCRSASQWAYSSYCETLNLSLPPNVLVTVTSSLSWSTYLFASQPTFIYSDYLKTKKVPVSRGKKKKKKTKLRSACWACLLSCW